ncbi:sulfotransferase 4 isoform X3 [Arctopsyche grandis]|uniref:sulfotransferase 4 isoform X3 n=1 Tax=Arctopsyche grandis TaxID=121162 RepID=UPI00406D6713
MMAFVEDANSKDNINNNDFPYEIKFVDKEINEQLLKDFTGERTGFVQVGKEKWFFPSKFIEASTHFYNFNVRPDDTWIVTYPRSGTTWTQELVWMIANDLDYDTSAKIPLTDRFPFFEFSIFVHDETKKEFLSENAHDLEKVKMVHHVSSPVWEILDKIKTPRFIKTHLPFSLLPPTILTSGCKVIYVARNPKDVAVSFYHLNKLIRTQGYLGDFPKYWNYFQNSLHAWTPYWSHVKEGWNLRDHPNVQFLFYEEMNKNLHATLRKVSKFLSKSFDEQQIEKLSQHLIIDNFRNNASVNYDVLKDLGILNSGEQAFIRKGKNGGWSEEFTQELSEQADTWIAENLKDTDLRFPKL